MKKSIFLCIMVLFMTSTMLIAQAPEWEWAKQTGGSGYDVGWGIDEDVNGNLYVTGIFSGTVTFGTTTLISSGFEDIFVGKLDAEGNWLWAKQAGGSDSDWGLSIKVDGNGNSYVTGYFKETATFGANILTSDGFDDIFVAKLDTDGNWQWAKQAGGTGWDYGSGICVDASGNSYITGNFTREVNFGSFTVTTGGFPEIFIAKIDTDGNWQWAKQAGGSTSDNGITMSVDGNGNLYLIGYFEGEATFGSTTLPGSGSYMTDVVVAKLDTDGNWQWAKQAGGNSSDYGYDIDVDANGNLYIIGIFSEIINFGDITLTASGSGYSYDVFVAKLDAGGNWQWARKAGGIESDNGKAISVDVNGNSYITGAFSGVADFGLFTLTSSGGNDVFVAKLDADGNWRWAKQAGGSGYEIGYGIVTDVNGNSYVTGHFTGEATFGAFTLTSVGSYEIFAAKLTDNVIIGDFNHDFYVNSTDLQLFGDHWQEVDTDPGWDAMYDLEPDGIINAADLQIFGDHWHEGTPPESAKGDGSKGPNSGAGIEFDLDATTYGNQNLTHIAPQAAGTMIRVDVYATGVHNLDTYEFNVVYDPAVLDYKGCAATNPLTFEENILTSEGGTAIGWMVDNSTPGILNIAYTLAGEDTTQAPEGEGLIADIVFQAKVTTYGMLSFSNVYYYDTFKVKDAITNLGTATLPVELSAFTATYNTVNGYTTLSWTTASETDILGYNVYRSTEDAFDASKQLNAAMINGHGTTTEMNTYEFVDVDQLNFGTTYYYWLESVEYGGMSTVYTSIKLTPEEGNGGFVDDFSSNSLSNYPNPFRNTTTISYSIKGMLKSEPVQISIYNMLGQLVDTVEGKYGTARWNTKDHSTGIYFYKLNTDNYTEIKKMMVTK